VPAATTTQGVSGHRPLPLHLQLLLAPPLNLPVSCNFFFFFLTNGLFAYCSLPPPLAVSIPPVTAAYATIMYRLGVVVTRLLAAAFWLGVWEIDDIVRVRRTGDST
jgi:hypothetical protein